MLSLPKSKHYVSIRLFHNFLKGRGHYDVDSARFDVVDSNDDTSFLHAILYPAYFYRKSIVRHDNIQRINIVSLHILKQANPIPTMTFNYTKLYIHNLSIIARDICIF